MTAVTLKPCPFCGQPPALEDGGDGPWVVGCRNTFCAILCDMDGADTAAQAAAAWNKRAAIHPVTGEPI